MIERRYSYNFRSEDAHTVTIKRRTRGSGRGGEGSVFHEQHAKNLWEEYGATEGVPGGGATGGLYLLEEGAQLSVRGEM